MDESTDQTAPEPVPDPWAIRDAWLSGTWTTAEGTTVSGRLWDDDSIYRWERYLDHWFTTHTDDLWQPDGDMIRDWAHSIIRFDNRQPLGPRSRARAVSIILSFYDHCETAHHLGPFRLPKRWKITGVIEDKTPESYQPWVTDALRTAADQFRGLPKSQGRGPHMEHPSRHRLACYLLLAGLRPKQCLLLRIENLRPNHTTKTLHAKIPFKHHADNNATFTGTLPWPIWRAVEDFLPYRQHHHPLTGPRHGVLLTSRSGYPYTGWNNFRNLIRPVIATHPDLTDITPELRPDWIAHSPSTWTHTRDTDQPDERPQDAQHIPDPDDEADERDDWYDEKAFTYRPWGNEA